MIELDDRSMIWFNIIVRELQPFCNELQSYQRILYCLSGLSFTRYKYKNPPEPFQHKLQVFLTKYMGSQLLFSGELVERAPK